MKRTINLTLSLAAISVSAFTLAFWGGKLITVESKSRGLTHYKIDTSGGVRLVKKLSDAPCIQGRSWGYDKTGVWVDDGCRAMFEVGEAKSSKPSTSSGAGMIRVTVESKNGKRTYHKINTQKGVTLVKKLSGSPCTYKKSWGYDKHGIWVDDGCRAVFEVQRDNGKRPPHSAAPTVIKKDDKGNQSSPPANSGRGKGKGGSDDRGNGNGKGKGNGKGG